MGRAPAAARLLSLYPLRPRIPAETGRFSGYFDSPGGRILSSPVPAHAERLAVFPRTLRICGGPVSGASGAGASVIRTPRPAAQLYTGIYMFRAQALLIPVLCAVIARAADFSGASALEFTKQVVALGPRPSGSEANRKLQAYILNHVKQDGCEVTEDAFIVRNPA